MRKGTKRAVALLLNIAVLLSVDTAIFAQSVVSVSESKTETRVSSTVPDYSDYLDGKEETFPEAAYVAESGTAEFPISQNAKKLDKFEGKNNVLLLNHTSGQITYQFTIAQAGFYGLQVNFFPLNDDSVREEIGVTINGSYPYREAEALYLNNQFVPETEEFRRNASGDEYAPRRVVYRGWTKCTLTDPNHDYDGAMRFWLSAGKNLVTVQFRSQTEIVLGEVKLCSLASVQDYQSYLKKYDSVEHANQIKVEAENIAMQSDSTVIPVSDQTDPLCSPASVKVLKINTIGESWSGQGQWLEWKFRAPETGWYQLSVRYKQNGLKGLAIKRSLFLDGEIPFIEAQNISFPYTTVWKSITVGEKDDPYRFYLTAGEHTLRLEAVLGELAQVVRDVDKIVYTMNTAYRSVIMVTSATADKYRDYQIEKELPQLIPTLEECAKSLEECNRKVEMLADGSSADSAILMTTAAQLRSMANNPETIPYRLSSWESNIGSISSWTLSIRQQPVQLDYFVFSGRGANPIRGKANLFEKVFHSFKRFFVSFIKDYNSLDNGENGEAVALTVWLGTGRDQAETVWQMANDMFTPDTGVKVNVKLVSATMIEAFLSGRAPDVSIQAARDIPVNLAVRGALLNLSSFDGFKEVQSWFTPDAFVPYTMQNCVYGIPDTQGFNMLFYRTDVFEELKLQVPKTWTEFVDVANQLHLKQLETGIPVDMDISMYYTLLMQRGGSVFSEDHSTTLLDGKTSVDAFTQWTDLFAKVGLPLSYNFFNRFRSGEMPMAIVPYINYNQLISAAPEIRNLWQMVPIPGTETEQGINRTESATGTAAVILSSTKHPNEAWELIRWWVGEEAQTRYAKDIESRVGVLGRVASANTNALAALDYPAATKNALMTQREAVTEIPQIPGNYYLDRDVLNAFRDVVYNSRNPKESILDYSNRINNEIDRKRKELGLE